MIKKWNLSVLTILLVLVLVAGVTLAATVPDYTQYAKGILQTTAYGKVQGCEANEGKTLIWKGIPYAKTLRWKAPENPDSWSGVFDATKKGNIALQLSGGKLTGSEDCLNLDIYRPNTAETNLPVLVYIHGGNNQTGNSNINMQQFVVAAKAIVVSIEYRLGFLGFNDLPALRTGNALEASGNYTLLDISKSLDWLKANIANFGGNPKNITVSGFSAGGRDVMAMLISPIFAGQFQKAISFSGGMTIANYEAAAKLIAQAMARLVVNDNVKKTEEEAYRWLLTKDKSVTDYLNRLSSDRIITVMPTCNIRMGVFPQLFNDGTVIPKDGFKTKKYNNVPLIMVTGSKEFATFTRSDPEFSAIKDDDLLTNPAIYKSYRFAVDYGSKLYGLANAQEAVEGLIGKYDAPIYTCDFDWGTDPAIVGAKLAKLYGPYHGIWQPFLTNEAGTRIPQDVFQTAGAQDLSRKFIKYITNFIWTGNPNSKGLVEWKPWQDAKTGPTQLLLNADKDKAIITMSQERVKYEDVLKEMEADTSIPQETKDRLIENVLNGRWFSGKMDRYFGNLNTWVQVD
jgi:para-nitrobenzyl esterase